MGFPEPKTDKRAGIPAPTTFRSPDGTNFRIASPKYDDKVARRICERIMMGDSLRKIAADPRMPSKRSIIRWLADPKASAFREMYYFARRVQAEVIVDEIIEIADDHRGDWKPIYNKDGDLVDIKADNEAIQRSRVRIDTRKWLASKMIPRMYGDNKHVDMDVTGDLAELLKSAANKDSGLPPPIEGESE